MQSCYSLFKYKFALDDLNLLQVVSSPCIYSKGKYEGGEICLLRTMT